MVNGKKMTDKISIAVCVMNRTDRIIECLSSWIVHEKVDEIVILDWSSNPPILDDSDVLQFINNNNKIKHLRIDNQKYYNVSKACNLCIQNTKNKYVLKIDIDHILINSTFLDMICDSLPLLDSRFYSGRHTTVVHWGIVLFDKNIFDKIQGYNEKLEGWGYEDSDLYDRMSKIIKEYTFVNIKENIYHKPHDDNLRVANYKIKDINMSHSINEALSKNE